MIKRIIEWLNFSLLILSLANVVLAIINKNIAALLGWMVSAILTIEIIMKK